MEFKKSNKNKFNKKNKKCGFYLKNIRFIMLQREKMIK